MIVDIAKRAIAACGGHRLAFDAAADIDSRALAIHIAGAGKASAQMAAGVSERLGGVASGLVITRDGAFSGFAPAGIEVCVAGHPEPDARSEAACARLERFLGERRIDELVVFVLSGGASSLLGAPLPGLTLRELIATTRALVASGLAIDDVNLVRRQLSRASAGRLARVCPARVEVLVLSDVVSGDLAAVGSGPFVPDETSPERALAILEPIDGVPPRVRSWLRDTPPMAPPPDDPIFARVRHRVLATPATLIETAVEGAHAHGDVGEVVHLPATNGHVDGVVVRLLQAAEGLPPRAMIVGGGEPSVSLPPKPGRGGRNQHLALLVAKAIAGKPFTFLSIGSDGSDGPTEAAGALVDGDSWNRLRAVGDPVAALARADAHPLLDAAGLLVRTGATGTNLCDLHLLAVS